MPTRKISRSLKIFNIKSRKRERGRGNERQIKIDLKVWFVKNRESSCFFGMTMEKERRKKKPTMEEALKPQALSFL